MNETDSPADPSVLIVWLLLVLATSKASPLPRALLVSSEDHFALSSRGLLSSYVTVKTG